MADFEKMFSGIDDSLSADFDYGKLDRIYNGLVRLGVPMDIVSSVAGKVYKDLKYGKDEIGGNMFIDSDDYLLDMKLSSVADDILSGRADVSQFESDNAYADDIRYLQNGNTFSEGGRLSSSDDWYDEAASEFSWYPSRKIIDYIKSAEGFRPYWYKDGNGIDTIGYGFTGDGIKESYPKLMSRDDADRELRRVIDARVKAFISATPNFDRLSSDQRDSLFDYYYNIGHGNYTSGSPKMQAALQSFDLNEVRNNIDAGYNDARNPGLKKRRDYERELFGFVPQATSATTTIPYRNTGTAYVPFWSTDFTSWMQNRNLDSLHQNKFEGGGELTLPFQIDKTRVRNTGIDGEELLKRSEDADIERFNRLRAEMFARYSAGIKDATDIPVFLPNLAGMISTWYLNKIPKKVKSVEMTPKEYLEDIQSGSNYSGTSDYDYSGDTDIIGRKNLQSNKYTKNDTNDFVSSFFNNDTPMVNAGVIDTPESNYPYLRRVYGNNYSEVVGKNKIRAYQVRPEHLKEAPVLDRIASEGKYDYSTEDVNLEAWNLANAYKLAYDANDHSSITVNYNGNKYKKRMDVFDVKGQGKPGTLTRNVSNFLTTYGNPYIVTTPWELVK